MIAKNLKFVTTNNKKDARKQLFLFILRAFNCIFVSIPKETGKSPIIPHKKLTPINDTSSFEQLLNFLDPSLFIFNTIENSK